ncbi:MAG: hypothetical protein ACEPOZ_06435 [Marinifilaceae bacterium]
MNQSRLYHGSDAGFISFSSPRINLIEEKHPDFILFSPHFTPEGLQALKDNYQEANSIPSDNVYVDIQAKCTENVETEMEGCRKFYKRLRFDVELAFPNEKKIWNQFGFNDYDLARRTAKHMNVLLTDVHMVATRYKETMLANGWTEETFETILTHKSNLKSLMDEQSQAVMERSRAAEQRGEKLNKLYEKLAVYFKAARIIYDEDEEMLQWFKFPSKSQAKQESEEEPQTEYNN